MMAWLRLHGQALRGALAKLARQRLASLLNALVIGVALALPAGGYAVLENLRGVASRFSLEPQVSVFLSPDSKAGDADAVGRRLGEDRRVASARYVPRDEALKSLARTEGFAEIVAALEKNPLPDAFVLKLRDPDPAALEALAVELRALPAVAHVQADSSWARRIAALVEIARVAMLILAALLAVGLLAVTFNSIRLQILTQRDEIEVSRLLGATDGFIQRPFYYLGAVQGLAGGLVALGAVAGGITLLNQGVRRLAATYGSSFELLLLGPGDALALLAFASLLGWLGANLSVSMYLREIEPK
jgi:cell division transport system permease protein